LCDPGPLSYQELRAAFDNALSDASVEAIVMRIESPGGMASGLFDLSDHVFSSRGKKPIIASLDDYAYSAAYGFAAACDEIWITRTGGAGSVGVISYHVDQSRWEQNMGVTVTQIYSGEHKADMSPHAPLSDTARTWLQERMDSVRGLFAATVAKYRGMELSAVLATEAQVYQGADAVAIGFADRVGTFAELMQQLAAGWTEDGDAMTEEREGTGEEMTAVPEGEILTSELVKLDDAAKAADSMNQLAVDIDATGEKLDQVTVEIDGAVESALEKTVDAAVFAVDLAVSTLPPSATVALIRRGPIAGQSTADAIVYARDVRDACFAAGLESTAPDYITKNTDLATVRAQLVAAKADAGPEIVTTIPRPSDARGTTRSEDIYSRRRAAAAGNGTSPRQ
jgi:signal peptide peptidase SppA